MRARRGLGVGYRESGARRLGTAFGRIEGYFGRPGLGLKFVVRSASRRGSLLLTEWLPRVADTRAIVIVVPWSRPVDRFQKEVGGFD